MQYPVAFFLPALVLVAGDCLGQVPRLPTASSHYLEIKFSREVISESVFGRYLLDGKDFGGWIQPRPGVSSYFISTTHEGRSATRIKALLYAPGCAIETLDLPDIGFDLRVLQFLNHVSHQAGTNVPVVGSFVPLQAYPIRPALRP